MNATQLRKSLGLDKPQLGYWVGAKVRFRPGVPIQYWQDFGFHRQPLPDVEFKVVSQSGNELRLRGRGFGRHDLGPGGYGSGAILVRIGGGR